ncbi:hypothetical protein FU139_30380 [Burkholderia territorii]|nr:hypothetical protein FU139_30380 [Burkholderia territorii]
MAPRQSTNVKTETKHLDTTTGTTWSGCGCAPAWIKDTKNQDRLLIQGRDIAICLLTEMNSGSSNN